MGETLWYGAAWRGEWVALASFSAAALKCQARDAWIGWTLRHKYDRLHLVANNTRFLILRPVPNLGSRVLGLCARHLVRDWPARFHHPLVLVETFVDPSRFVGTVYRAAGWTEVGMTRGFRRARGGYRAGSTPKKVLVRPLSRQWRSVVASNGKTVRRTYETTVVATLRDRLRAGDVWVEGSRDYGKHQNPWGQSSRH